MSGIQVLPVAGLPEVAEGMRIGNLVAERIGLADGDVLVVSQKIVSKAEGRVRRLSSVEPGDEARRLGASLGKEPALVELILAESREVLRAERGVLIVETHHGFVCANAGIDSSNLPDPDTVSLLPEDPDASARRIRAEIAQRSAGAGVGSVGQKRGVSAGPPPAPSGGGDLRQFRPRLAARPSRSRDRLCRARPARRLARAAATRAAGSWRRPRSRSPTRRPRRPTWCVTRRTGFPPPLSAGLRTTSLAKTVPARSPYVAPAKPTSSAR